MPDRLMAHRSFLLVLALLGLAIGAIGQGRFTVNGRMKVEGGALDGARAVVYKNGAKERTITSGLNKFSLDLEINATYIISFEKDGYVAKKLSFNTNAPAEAIPNGFTPFDFAVSLFEQYDDINLVMFNQPVGMIHYDKKLGDFDYDTDYTRSIQSQLQEVLDKVAERQKNAGERAKEREEEAKALAKAEAQAIKDAEALARSEEKRKEEERKEAEKNLAEQAKAKELEKEITKEKEAALAVQPAPPPEPVEAPRKPSPPIEAKVAEKPTPRVSKPQSNGLVQSPRTGEDDRRSAMVRVEVEDTRIAKANVNIGEERPVFPRTDPSEESRNEELVVEKTRVTAIVRVTVGDRSDEYRKVTHKWGAQFFFKNGETCSQQQYEAETRTEALAGATPKMGR